MTGLHQRHCLNHAGREAVARCPHCGQFYCRECIAEHDDQIICAACLRKLLRPTLPAGHPTLDRLRRGAAFCLSLAVGWLAFYAVGKILLSIPVSVHNGTLWQTDFFQE